MLNEGAVAIAAIGTVLAVERIINQRVPERTAAPVTGHFVG